MGGLAFLTPLYLAGAAAVAIPLAIHFLSKRKVEETRWSDIRFIREAIAKRKRDLVFENLKLLLLRMLLILLLALAFSRPVLKSAQTSLAAPGKRTHAIFIVDGSLSMAAIENGISRMERARERLREIHSHLSLDDRVSLILAGDSPETILHGIEVGAMDFFPMIDRLAPKYSGSALGSAIGLALSLDVEETRREIYLVTDMQKCAWEEVRFLKEEMGIQDADLYLVNLSGGGLTNIAPTGYHLARREETGVGLEIEPIFKVECFGPAPESTVSLRYILAGKERTAVPIRPLPGRPVRQSFSSRIREPLPLSGYVETERDALSGDNRFFFALDDHRSGQVLLLDGGGDIGRNSDNFYLGVALETLSTAWGLMVRVERVPQELTLTSFEAYDLVILADVPRISERSARALGTYIENGGGGVVFLGPGIDSGNYNERLFPHWIPARLRQTSVRVTEPLSIVQRAVDHPIFALFDRDGLDLGIAHFFGFWQTDPESRVEARGLAYLKDRQPLLVEKSHGRGSVLIFFTSAGGDWTDFQTWPIYLPWIGEIVRVMMGRDTTMVDYRIGDVIPIRIASTDETAPTARLRVLLPDGSTLEKKIDLISGSAVLPFGETEQPGIYRFEASEGGGNTGVFPRIAAVNIDPSESDLTTLSVEETIERLSAFRVAVFEPRGSLLRSLSGFRRGRPIWDYLLLLLLPILVLEPFYANRQRGGA